MAEISEDGVVGTSAQTLFTSPSNQVTIFASLTLKDESGGAMTVDIHMDNNGDAVSDTNRLVTVELEAYESRTITEVQGKRLAQGGKIYAQCDSGANDVNYFLSGRTVPQTAPANTVG